MSLAFRLRVARQQLFNRHTRGDPVKQYRANRAGDGHLDIHTRRNLGNTARGAHALGDMTESGEHGIK